MRQMETYRPTLNYFDYNVKKDSTSIYRKEKPNDDNAGKKLTL